MTVGTIRLDPTSTICFEKRSWVAGSQPLPLPPIVDLAVVPRIDRQRLADQNDFIHLHSDRGEAVGHVTLQVHSRLGLDH